MTGRSRLRASDADRERVIDALKAAFVQGRLTRDELSGRTGQALASRTYGDLAAVTSGIPVRRVAAQPQQKPAQPHRRRADRKTVAWAVCTLLLPTTLGAAFVTYYVGFLVLFMLAFIGVTITAQP